VGAGEKKAQRYFGSPQQMAQILRSEEGQPVLTDCSVYNSPIQLFSHIAKYLKLA
jgi:hypothetical protein